MECPTKEFYRPFCMMDRLMFEGQKIVMVQVTDNSDTWLKHTQCLTPEISNSCLPIYRSSGMKLTFKYLCKIKE